MPNTKNVLRMVYLHEGRHTYQASRTLVLNNDKDFDMLPAYPHSIAPTDVMVDSSTSRLVCNQETDMTLDKTYKGDSSLDSYGHPDFASYAWEMDAWLFSSNN